MPRASETFSLLLHAKALAERKFLLLFLFLLAALLLYPYAESSAFGYYAFRVFGSVTIVFCVYAVNVRRSLVIAAIVLAIPTFLQRILGLGVNPGAIPIANIVLSFAFDLLIVVVIFRRVFVPGQTTSERIFGALSMYLLMGFAFASVYAALTFVQSRAFYLDPALNTHLCPDRLDLIYYSFATMTCVGALGISPVSGEARCLTVIEAIIGVLYLAVLISRLGRSLSSSHLATLDYPALRLPQISNGPSSFLVFRRCARYLGIQPVGRCDRRFRRGLWLRRR
jgi:hypothetical protein